MGNSCSASQPGPPPQCSVLLDYSLLSCSRVVTRTKRLSRRTWSIYTKTIDNIDRPWTIPSFQFPLHWNWNKLSGLSKDLRNQFEVLNISKTDTKQQGWQIYYLLQLLITVLTFLINCPIPFDPLSWASIGTNKAYLVLSEGNSHFFNLKRKKWTQKKIVQDHPILAWMPY